MKIDRLLNIIHILMKEDKVTAPYLANVLEVSRRTINRDIDTILLAGIPIVTSQGFDGGIWLDDHYKMDKTLLKVDELQAIFDGLKGIDSVSNISYIDSLKHRLSLSNTQYFVKQDVLLIDLASHYRPELIKKISIIKEAILSRKKIVFSYYHADGKDVRTIEPHLLAYQWSSWYVVGYCIERRDFRMFKLNRLSNLVSIDDSFEYRILPDDITNFSDYFKANVHVRAVFKKASIYRVIDEYGMDNIYKDKEDTYLFTWDFTNIDYAYSWFSSFGSDVKILEPTALRHRLLDNAKELIKIYET